MMMKNTYEIYPKNLVAQNMVFQNMSNHYRRIYNAKPRIDTRSPMTQKVVKSMNSEQKRSKSGLRHVTNNSPSKLFECDKKVPTYRQCCSKQNINCMIDDTPPFRPKILTSVESKLRNLKVYHPPRRRAPIHSFKERAQSSASPDRINDDEEEEVEEQHWIQTVNSADKTKSHTSKPCSSDSAYTEEGEAEWSGGTSPCEGNTLPPTPVLEWNSSQRSFRSDDLLYVKFLREITEEVLRKGVFTNKALKQIFQNHIKANQCSLNMARMQEEIEKLRIELAIPKEDYLNDMDYGLGDDSRMTAKDSNFQDDELLDALNQLDISEELKADVASSLGFRPVAVVSRQISETSSRTDCNVRDRVQINREELHIHLPSSDEDNGFEVSSEFSDSPNKHD